MSSRSLQPDPAPGRGAGDGAPDRGPAPAGGLAVRALDAPQVVWLVLGTVAIYVVLWWLGQGPLDEVYTAKWTSGRLAWFYAPVTILLAVVSRRVLPTLLSILGLVLGVAVGQLIGSRIFAAETARLEDELTAGGLQTWEPTNPGWWIAWLVFIALTAVGALIAWRSSRRVA